MTHVLAAYDNSDDSIPLYQRPLRYLKDIETNDEQFFDGPAGQERIVTEIHGKNGRTYFLEGGKGDEHLVLCKYDEDTFIHYEGGRHNECAVCILHKGRSYFVKETQVLSLHQRQALLLLIWVMGAFLIFVYICKTF